MAKSKTPKIRFKGFTDDWEQRKLGEIVQEITRKDPASDAPIMMITANNGFIEQSQPILPPITNTVPLTLPKEYAIKRLKSSEKRQPIGYKIVHITKKAPLGKQNLLLTQRGCLYIKNQHIRH